MYLTPNYNFHVPDSPGSLYQQLKMLADDIDAVVKTIDDGGGTGEGGGTTINPTTGVIPVRISPTAFGDSLITDTGSSININGPVAITGGLNVNGSPILPATPHPITSVFGRTGAIVAQAGDYPVNKGGTGIYNYTIGDLLVADSATSLTTLPDTVVFRVLISKGVGVMPAWGLVNLNNAVTGLLPVTSGGTGTTTVFTAGSVVFARAAGLYTENNAQFFWDNTNFRLGLGVTTPLAALEVRSTVSGHLRLSQSTGAYTDFVVDSGGGLALNSTGSQIDPASGYTHNLGRLTRKYLTLHVAELWAETLVAQNTIATIGGRILVGPTTQLTADLAAGTGTIFVKHNQMSSGDVVVMQANNQIEFMAVTSAPSGSGPYSYSVTRDLDGSGSNSWSAGDAVFNTGKVGNGFIDLYSIAGLKSGSQLGPAIVGNVRNTTSYADWSEHWAIGNLNGVYGYGTNIYGAAFGKYAVGASYVTIDATNGYRAFGGSPTTQRIGLKNDGSGFLANNNIRWDTTGNAFIAGWFVGSTRLSSPLNNIYLDSATQFVSTGYPTAPPEFLGSSGFWVGGRFGGLTAFWKLDGSADTLGGRVLTNSNVGYSAGKIGNCAGFNAAGAQYLVCANDAGLNANGGSFMACIWYQRTTISSLYQAMVVQRGASNYGWDLTMQSPNRICLQVTTTTGAGFSCVPPVDYADTAWHFIFVWYDSVSSTINLQIDNGGIYTTSVTSGVVPTDGSIYFGHPSFNLFGYLDAFAFGKFVPSATMRTALWNNGAGTETVTYTAMHLGTVAANVLTEGVQWNGTQLLISAAGGVTTIDSNGIRLKSSPAFTPASAYEIVDANAPTVVLGALYDTTQFSTDHSFILQAQAAAGRNSNLLLLSNAPTGKNAYAQFGVTINSVSVSYLSMNDTTGMQFWVGGKKRMDIDAGTNINLYGSNHMIWVPQDGTQLGLYFVNATTSSSAGRLFLYSNSAGDSYNRLYLTANAPSGGASQHCILLFAAQDNSAQQAVTMFLAAELNAQSRISIYPTAGTFKGVLISDALGDGPVPFGGALLQLNSTTKGFLLPRVTSAQNNAIGAQNGTIIFNSDLQRVRVVAGGAWWSLAIPQYSATLTKSTNFVPTINNWSMFPMDTPITDLAMMRGQGGNAGLVAPVTGTYLVRVRMKWPAIASGQGWVGCAKNAAYTSPFLAWQSPMPTTVPTYIGGAGTIALNAGDFVHMLYFDGTGVTLVVGEDYPQFSMSLVG